MVAKFLKFLASREAVPVNWAAARPLVATSGGVDSVVLCHLFHQAGLPFAIAHCNFQLRGEAADLDEALVKKLAEELAVPFYATRFETQFFAEQNKLSIQVAARQLRYGWLEETRQAAGCHFIATAHHLNDSVETLLYNFTKGCGLRGLHGIPFRNGHIVRPLLFATKKQVLDFAEQNKLAYREDASNLTDKYNRNKLRHHVVPVLEDINPSFIQTAGENIQRLLDAELLMDFALAKIKEDLLETGENEWRIDLQKLRSCPAPATVLFEILKEHGYNAFQVSDILQSIDNQSGSIFYAPPTQLLLDRSFLVLKLGGNIDGVKNISLMPDSTVSLPDGTRLSLTLQAGRPDSLATGPERAWLDADKLQFPLRLRHWQPGDWFCPFGMGGKRQKLQDFFSNHKLSRFEKDRVWLLESGGEIAWIVGMRLDERFKVSEATVNCALAAVL
jgi:tRNA(Ile)-lysidine synthase